MERRHFSLGRTLGSVEQHDGEFSGFSFCLKYRIDTELKQPIIQKCQWNTTNNAVRNTANNKANTANKADNTVSGNELPSTGAKMIIIPAVNRALIFISLFT